MIRDMTNMQTFAKRLAWLMGRAKSGPLSERALAKTIGVSKQTVANWLRSGIVPRGDNLRRLARLFDVSEYWLEYGDIESEPGWPTRVRGVAEKLVVLPAGRLDLVEQLVDDWLRE